MEVKRILLKDLATLSNGFAFKGKDFIESGVPVLKIKNVKPNKILLDDVSYVSEEIAKDKEAYIIRENDILLTLTGNRSDGSPESWVGKSALFKEKGIYLLNQRLCIIRPKSDLITTKYLAYFLSSWEVQLYLIQRANSSGGQANISPEIVNSIEVPVPSVETQEKIVKILETIDLKIKNSNSIINNLKEQMKLLFREMFISFEFWNDARNEEWNEVSLQDCVVIKRGGSPRPIQEYMAEEGLNWLKISDVTSLNTPYVSSVKEKIKIEGLKKTVHLEKGSLILSNSATPGIPIILNIDSCIHDGWLYFKDSVFSKEFLYCLFVNIRKELLSYGNGSVFTNLKTDIVKEYKIRKPDASSLELFDSFAKPAFLEMLQKTNEINNLIAMREMLSSRLLTGEIDLENIEL